jgi:hypothetical protein
MRRETSPVVYLPRFPEKPIPKSGTEFLEGELFTLLRSRAELLAKVTEDFILQSRFTANEIFDGFGEGNLVSRLLQLLGDDDR